MKNLNINVLSTLKDNRSKCLSILCELPIGEYLKFINETYNNRGGISGQRSVLTSKSAITIRNRMEADIEMGAILPPVVVGLPIEDELAKMEGLIEKEDLGETLVGILDENKNSIALIDGMQRTTALKNAFDRNQEVGNQRMRLEVWLTENNNGLLYRMLVLNTGQIPWDVRKQLEVMFRSITIAITTQIPEIKVYNKEDRQHRTSPMEYQGDDLIEMFIAFSTRKEKVDSKDHLSSELTKIELTENSSRADMVNNFIRVLKIFGRLDKIFCRDKRPAESQTRTYTDGKSLMSSQPLRIGFMTAIAIAIFGKPGRDKTTEQQSEALKSLETKIGNLFEKLDKLGTDELVRFVDTDTLNEMRPKATSRIGEHDRRFFRDAFEELFKSLDDLPAMTECWRAG